MRLFSLASMAFSLVMLSSVSSQAASTVATTVDSGNTAWLLMSAALVMLMTPGLAFFYAGMVHRKNVVSTLLQNFVALAVVGLLWVACGFSMAFAEGNAILGDLRFAFFKNLSDLTYNDTGIPYLAYAAYQMMFAIITPALITGSFAERVHFKAWLVMMILWSLSVYVPVAHWVWGPGGWIEEMGAIDFAGGLVVHITAGFSALVCALLFGKRNQEGHTVPNDIPMIMLGAALLFFGWFGFNAGSALTAGKLASHAFITTFVGAAASFCAWMVVDWLKTGRPSAVGAMIGLVVGLVAITPAAGFVKIEHAIMLCAVAGVLCNLFTAMMKRISHLDDALDVFSCHGVGAVIGAIATGLLASRDVNPALEVEGFLISGETKLFVANTLSTAIVAVYAMVVTFVLIKLITIFMPLRVSEEEEGAGLDTTMHGEVAKFHPRPRPNSAPSS
jgi:ammonium transporter, Amt family